MSIHLYGSLTSPYVRRVRIILMELGQEYSWTDTTTEQAALRAATPLWKIPVAIINGETVFDSAVITQRLLQEFGHGPLTRFEPSDWQTRNVLSVTDGVLDSLINVFYLRKEGVTAEQAPYLRKQSERAGAAMTWLEQRMNGPWLSATQQWGVPEIALLSALEWMRFRATYPVEEHPRLMQFLASHAQRPSVVATKPPA